MYEARSSDRTGPPSTQRSGVRSTRATKVPVDAHGTDEEDGDGCLPGEAGPKSGRRRVQSGSG